MNPLLWASFERLCQMGELNNLILPKGLSICVSVIPFMIDPLVSHYVAGCYCIIENANEKINGLKLLFISIVGIHGKWHEIRWTKKLITILDDQST